MQTNYTNIPSREQILDDARNDIGWYVLSVTTLILCIKDDQLNILLEKRGITPEEGMWLIPGKFLNYNRTLEETAREKLAEVLNINNPEEAYLEQLNSYSDPNKTLGKRVVTNTHLLLVPSHNLKIGKQNGIKDLQWFPVKRLPDMAFDHKSIIKNALEQLKNKIEYSDIVFSLLPNKFRLSTLQRAYEIILGKKLNKRNFRTKILSLNLLKETGQKEIEGAHRPAMLYQFKNRKVNTY